MESSSSTLMSLLPMLIMTIPFAIIANILAKQKGRNVTAWTILGLIPLVSYISIIYFIGASNLRHEDKMDRILEKLETKQL